MQHMKSRHRSLAARVLVTAAAVVTLGGCATKGDLRDLQMELRTLAARQDTLLVQIRMQALSTQDTLRTQSDQIFDFRGEITRQLRLIGESLGRIEALAGENQRGLASVRDQLATMRRQGPAAGPAVVDSSAVAGGLTPGLGDAPQLYRTARDLHNRGSMTTARMAYQQFLETYPNHELAPDAMFYMGTILFEEDEAYDDALALFREIQSRFPTAPRLPSALYWIALVQIEQDDIDDAIETLERIVNTYTGTDIAELAQQRLDEIR